MSNGLEIAAQIVDHFYLTVPAQHEILRANTKAICEGVAAAIRGASCSPPMNAENKSDDEWKVICDSYAEENQRLSDEIAALRSPPTQAENKPLSALEGEAWDRGYSQGKADALHSPPMSNDIDDKDLAISGLNKAWNKLYVALGQIIGLADNCDDREAPDLLKAVYKVASAALSREEKQYQCSICESDWGGDREAALNCCRGHKVTSTTREEQQP